MRNLLRFLRFYVFAAIPSDPMSIVLWRHHAGTKRAGLPVVAGHVGLSDKGGCEDYCVLPPRSPAMLTD